MHAPTLSSLAVHRCNQTRWQVSRRRLPVNDARVIQSVSRVCWGIPSTRGEIPGYAPYPSVEDVHSDMKYPTSTRFFFTRGKPTNTLSVCLGMTSRTPHTRLFDTSGMNFQHPYPMHPTLYPTHPSTSVCPLTAADSSSSASSRVSRSSTASSHRPALPYADIAAVALYLSP